MASAVGSLIMKLFWSGKMRSKLVVICTISRISIYLSSLETNSVITGDGYPGNKGQF